MTKDALTALRLGRQTFPGLWRHMMPPEFSQLRFPDEKQAQCAACPKICEESWRPDYRCCTYHPRMSNFLLGLSLRTPDGEKAVDEVIARGMLLPEGMHSSPRQWLDFLDDQYYDQFGRSTRVLCPMLDPDLGLCRAHNFRNAVCSTYFCHKDQGSAGELFWSQIQTLGTQLEMRLSQWALEQIGFDGPASRQVLDELAPEIDRVSGETGWKPEILQRIWGKFWGREKELLAACAAVVLDHADELWTLAQGLTIAEAQIFDQALTAQIPGDQLEFLEEEETEWEPVDLLELWQDCQVAHDALWTTPEGLFTLSPNVHFIGKRLEYRYQDPAQTLAFDLLLSDAEKALLQTFAGVEKPLPDLDFLRDMMHRKVLWKV